MKEYNVLRRGNARDVQEADGVLVSNDGWLRFYVNEPGGEARTVRIVAAGEWLDVSEVKSSS